MPWRLLADATLLLHAAFIAFVVLGGLAAWRWPWAPWLHLPAAAWGAYVELAGRLCPLTSLENFLRARAGQAGFEGGFVEHYLVPLIYPAGLTRELQGLLAAVVVLSNLLIYGGWWLRRRRRQARPASP